MIRLGLLAALRIKGGGLLAGDLGEEVFRALGFETKDEDILSEFLVEPDLFGNATQEADAPQVSFSAKAMKPTLPPPHSFL